MGKQQNLTTYSCYHAMGDWARDTLLGRGLTERNISRYFDNYALTLPLLFRLVFRCTRLGIRLRSYEGSRVAAATISQMEKPAGSAYLSNTAVFIRSDACLRAPVFHADALDPMAGVKGMLEIDLFNVNPADVSVDEFLGENIAQIKQALEIAAPYQIPPEKGRGKYSRHMDPYKCAYRLELGQPDAGDADALQRFFQAELEAFKLYTGAYLASLEALVPEAGIVTNNKTGFDTFVEVLLKKDFVARAGKMLFRKDFNRFFHEGCWRTGYYGSGAGVPDNG